jgi:Methyltransferase domain
VTTNTSPSEHRIQAVTDNTRTTIPLSRLRYMGRATKAYATDPYEALERTLEKVAEWRDDRAIGTRYVVTEAPDERLHQLVGTEWPCGELDVSEHVWAEALEELSARDLRVGRGAFGGWDDGDKRLVRFAWCLARHLRPERVLETGVARGFTTRALLEALNRNGNGHVWSVDLPPLLERGLSDETGAAVPGRLYDRWTLVRGSSRRVLPGLVKQLGSIDLFVHDSMHTTRNVAFELECVWPTLRPGGAILIDDVEKNAAMGQFLRSHPGTASMICASDDGRVLIGLLIKS